MTDVALQPAVIGIQNTPTGTSFAGQDLEGQAIGTANPFTFSVEQGFVTLGFDFITFTPISFNEFDAEDLEGFAPGPIALIPSSPPAIAYPFVSLLEGDFLILVNDGFDDCESYLIGVITQLNNSISNGDITMFVGLIRPNP